MTARLMCSDRQTAGQDTRVPSLRISQGPLRRLVGAPQSIRGLGWRRMWQPLYGAGWTVGSKAVSWVYALCSLAVIAVYPWLTEAGRLAAFRLVAFATIPAVVLGARAYRGGGRWPIWLVLCSAD
jgi:hypothetical protein